MDFKEMMEENRLRNIQHLRGLIQSDTTILDVNKEDLLNFDVRNANNGKVNTTRSVYLKALIYFAKSIDVPFKDVSREKIDKFIYGLKTGEGSLSKKPLSPAGINIYVISIGKLYKMLYNAENRSDLPESVKHLKTIRIKGGVRKLQKEDLLTPKEVELMVHTQTNPRNRCLIKVMFESGGRISEILSLRRRDITFNAGEAVLNFRMSKTKERPALIIDSLPELKEWYNKHPTPHDLDAPFWITYSGNSITICGAAAILKSSARMAGIQKRVFNHLCRHSIVTWRKRNGMQQDEANITFGWSDMSDSFGRYSHFNQEDAFNRLRVQSGKSKILSREEDEPMKQFEVCPNCNKEYPVGTAMCSTCHLSFSAKVSSERLKSIAETARMVEEFKRLQPLLEQMKKVEPFIQMFLERSKEENIYY